MKNLFFKKAGKIIVFSVVLITVFLFNSQQGKTQTTLSVGDIAITGINMDGNDSLSFIVLRSGGVLANTTIIFTDKGWDGSALSTGEGTVTWNTPAISQYDQFVLQGLTVYKINSDGTRSTAGSCSGTSMSLAIGGDQVFIIQGSTGSPTFLTGVHVNVEISTYPVSGALVTTKADWDATNYVSGGGSYSRLSGTGLTTDVSALWLRDTTGTIHSSGYWEIDDGRAKCSALTGTAAQIFAKLMIPSNWDMRDDSAYYPVAPICSSPTSTTWNGSTWSNGAPTSTLDAIIAGSATPGAFTCKNLTINSTYTLTLGSGVTATIYGDLTNNGNGTSGVGTLRFAGATAQAISGTAFTHSGVVEVATSTTLTTNSKLTIANGGSLMHGTGTTNGGGSISGSVTFEKTIGSTSKGWRIFSLPVASTIDNFETGLNTYCSNHTPSGEINVYYWNGTDVGSAVAAGFTQASTTDDENKAYSIFLDNTTSGIWDFSSTVSISGTPNDGTKTFNLDWTFDPNSTKTLANEKGWNMIPNYFPSNLSVVNLIGDPDFIPGYKAVHVWDQGSSQMVGMNSTGMNGYNNSSTSVYTSTRQVPPFMGFWVKANNNSQSIQVKNAHRTSNSDSLPADTYFKTDFDIFRMEVKDAEGHADQFSTAFVDGATYNFDNEFDLYKFKSFSDLVPTLYTKVDGEMLSLSSMPIETNYTVPVFMESYTDGKLYTVKAITEEYKNYFDVELVDNKTGTKTDLLNDDYTFNFDKNFTSARFTLNFRKKGTTSIDELYNQEKMYAYTGDGAINVSYSNNNVAANATVEVYNMMGQKLFSQANVKSGDVVKYNTVANGQVQVYIVKVISNGKAKTIKVVN